MSRITDEGKGSGASSALHHDEGRRTEMLSFLRDATKALHQQVDDAFARFRLDEAESYGAMLRAHARALPAAETVLENSQTLPPWRTRWPQLAADLATLGISPPPVLPFAAADAADALGILYVTEGSRLGGIMLARQVGQGLPKAYLSAGHRPGEWQALLRWIDEAITIGGPQARADALAGAQRTFALYERAAALD